MTRFGKKMVMVGIWAGIGILIGLQFGGSGSSRPPACCRAGTLWPADTAGLNGQASGWTKAAQREPRPCPAAGYNPGRAGLCICAGMAIDPATGAYTLLPVSTELRVRGRLPDSRHSLGAAGSEGLQQQYPSRPEQILIPQEQKPTVDVTRRQDSGLLQQASQKGIRWVVSLFASTDE
jgi:hypothetical protein